MNHFLLHHEQAAIFGFKEVFAYVWIGTLGLLLSGYEAASFDHLVST